MQGGDLVLKLDKFYISASALFPDCFKPYGSWPQSPPGNDSPCLQYKCPTHTQKAQQMGRQVDELRKNLCFKFLGHITFSLFSFCYPCMVTSSRFSWFCIKFEL